MIRGNSANAIAYVVGDAKYPEIRGTVTFRQMRKGVWVSADIYGLPDGFHGFHIHQNGICDKDKNFDTAGGHYNPTETKHPNHAGDMPPLLSCDRMARMEFYTCRFDIADIIGRSIIIHEKPDDFTTDPSGNSGNKIACGIIKKA